MMKSTMLKWASDFGTVIVVPVVGTGRAGNLESTFSNQVELKERPLEDLLRGWVRASSSRLSALGPMVESKSTNIPLPIRNDSV